MVACDHKECRYKYSRWWIINKRVKVCSCGWRQERWLVERERGGEK